MFIIKLTYSVPTEVVDTYLEAHRQYLRKYIDSGYFILAGRRVPRNGGVIIGSAESIDRLWEILHEDPFYLNGVGEYEILEFTPTVWKEEFEEYKDK